MLRRQEADAHVYGTCSQLHYSWSTNSCLQKHSDLDLWSVSDLISWMILRRKEKSNQKVEEVVNEQPVRVAIGPVLQTSRRGIEFLVMSLHIAPLG